MGGGGGCLIFTRRWRSAGDEQLRHFVVLLQHMFGCHADEKDHARIVRLTSELVMNEMDLPSGSGNKPKLVLPGEYVIGMSSVLT